MAGPSWLAGLLAAAMILTAGYAASRLALSRLRRLPTEADTDGVHALMGAAMAGMLVPQLSLLPGSVWAVVFGIAAAWFAGRAVRLPGLGAPGGWYCRFPVPHLVECAAMLYMSLSARGAQHGPAMAMTGMSTSPGQPAAFPALALLLTMFMLGYILWTTDQLASRVRARATATGPSAPAAPPVTPPGGGEPGDEAGRPGDRAGARGSAGAAGRPALAPGLAACGKIAMGLTMGYMLILMI